MSSTRSRQQPLAENAHRRILRAGAAAFAEHGYAATSVEQLLLSAQLDLPTFEAHFNDTEDCFLQAYDCIVAEAAALIVASLPVAAPWPQRLAAGLSTLFELVDDDRAAARLVLVEAQSAFPTAMTRHLPTIDRVALFMREARAVPSNDPPPPLLDSVLPNGIAFMLGNRLSEQPHDSVADLFPEALHLLLLPFLGEPETTDFLAAASLPKAVTSPGSAPRLP